MRAIQRGDSPHHLHHADSGNGRCELLRDVSYRRWCGLEDLDLEELFRAESLLHGMYRRTVYATLSNMDRGLRVMGELAQVGALL